MSAPALLAAHSSDVHVDDDFTAAQFGGDGARQLDRVLEAARSADADILLLAGDTLDHNRLPQRVIERTAALLAAFPRPIVILPGNHDPATVDSPYRRSCFRALSHVHVLGVNCEASIRFENFALEIWGRPHTHFADMAPLAGTPDRTAARRIVMAHGHYEPTPSLVRPRPSWLFGDADLAACDADYVALGHWNRAVEVGRGPSPAWYSGSPDVAGAVNLIRFDRGAVAVSQHPLKD